MLFYIKRALIVLILAFAIIYAVDFGVLEYRTTYTTEGIGSIPVQHFYVVKEKGNKVEYMLDTPTPEACVNSIFPHWGHPPCWYLKRHTRKRVDL